MTPAGNRVNPSVGKRDISDVWSLGS